MRFLGCHGLEKEGWFDPWALLCGLSNRAKQLGANYTNAELVGFEYRDQPDMIIQGGGPNYKALDKAIVKMPNGEIKTIKFGICIIAAGAKSGEIARLANIGVGSGLCSMPLPVEPRYCLDTYTFYIDLKSITFLLENDTFMSSKHRENIVQD